MKVRSREIFTARRFTGRMKGVIKRGGQRTSVTWTAYGYEPVKIGDWIVENKRGSRRVIPNRFFNDMFEKVGTKAWATTSS